MKTKDKGKNRKQPWKNNKLLTGNNDANDFRFLIRNHGSQIGKEEIKLFLLSDNMIFFVDNLKGFTKYF